MDTLEENHQIPTTDIMQDSKKDTVTAITATVYNSHGLASVVQQEKSKTNFFGITNTLINPTTSQTGLLKRYVLNKRKGVYASLIGKSNLSMALETFSHM